MAGRLRLLAVVTALLAILPAAVSVSAVPVAADATHATVAARPALVTRASAVPVLMYHFIRVNPVAGDQLGFHLSVTPENFARQMALLSLSGRRAVTLDAVLDAVDRGAPLPADAVVLTFDDGFESFASAATPIMRSLGMKGTDYVVPGFIDTPGYMSRGQLASVIGQGMTVGAHTMRHNDLAPMSDQDAAATIGLSRTTLQQWTGQPVDTFAYPYGSFNPRTPELVRAAGFRGALTTVPGADESPGVRMTMPRVRIDGSDDIASFASRLGIGLPARAADPRFWTDLDLLTAGALHGSTVALAATSSNDYRIVDRSGLVRSYGRALDAGSVTFDLNRPVVGAASSSSGMGYWLVASDGGIFPFGDAGGYGSTGDMRLNQPMVGLAATPSGKGYWLVAADGGVFPFGDAGGYGSTGNLRLNRPVVGMAATPTGKGYWLVAADGGVFPFGDAGGYGSTGNLRLNRPVVGMAATPTGKGYWLVAADGGIFPFGDAGGYGSTGGVNLVAPVVGMAGTRLGDGYWLVAADGGVFPFGAAPGLGSGAV